MAAGDLTTFTPAQGQVYYLDTSALVALAAAEADRLKPIGLSWRVAERAKRVAIFLKATQAKGALPRTTVLAMQELAAVTRNEERRKSAAAAGHATWNNFKLADRPASVAADAGPQAAMLQMMECAARQLGAFGVELAEPEVLGADSLTVAKQRRKAHRDLLRKYVELDPMDALHILLGAELGSNTFVTFDKGWESVPTISVLT